MWSPSFWLRLVMIPSEEAIANRPSRPTSPAKHQMHQSLLSLARPALKPAPAFPSWWCSSQSRRVGSKYFAFAISKLANNKARIGVNCIRGRFAPASSRLPSWVLLILCPLWRPHSTQTFGIRIKDPLSVCCLTRCRWGKRLFLNLRDVEHQSISNVLR
jgi:hypothetical protein